MSHSLAIEHTEIDDLCDGYFKRNRRPASSDAMASAGHWATKPLYNFVDGGEIFPGGRDMDGGDINIGRYVRGGREYLAVFSVMGDLEIAVIKLAVGVVQATLEMAPGGQFVIDGA